MNISLRDVVKISGNFEENLPYGFAKLFGTEMELSQSNIGKFLKQIDYSENDFFSSLLELLDEEETKQIVKQVGVDSCPRCWEFNREEVLFEAGEKFNTFSKEEKQNLIIKQFEILFGEVK